jgi:site-specific DNA recombinase
MMTPGRAAIYARFSSDLQRDRSIDDQVALCREYAARNGYEVVAIFEDRALTGASIKLRAGIRQCYRPPGPAHSSS